MGVSTAGVLSLQIYFIAKLSLVGHTSPFINYTNLVHGFYGFFKLYSFWSMGVVLKRTKMFVLVVGL